jgi:hypothetical protein
MGLVLAPADPRASCFNILSALSQLRCLAHNTAPRDHGARLIDLNNQTARATTGAHRTPFAIWKDYWRIGDPATACLNNVDRLTGHRAKGTGSIDAIGEKSLGELGMNMNGNLRHDRLLPDKQLRLGANAPCGQVKQFLKATQIMWIQYT